MKDHIEVILNTILMIFIGSLLFGFIPIVNIVWLIVATVWIVTYPFFHFEYVRSYREADEKIKQKEQRAAEDEEIRQYNLRAARK